MAVSAVLFSYCHRDLLLYRRRIEHCDGNMGCQAEAYGSKTLQER